MAGAAPLLLRACVLNGVTRPSRRLIVKPRPVKPAAGREIRAVSDHVKKVSRDNNFVKYS